MRFTLCFSTLCFSALVLGALAGTFAPRTAEGDVEDLVRSRLSDLVCCECSGFEDFSNDKVTNDSGAGRVVTVFGAGSGYEEFHYPHGQSLNIADEDDFTFTTVGERTSHCDNDISYDVEGYVTGFGLCFEADAPFNYGVENGCCGA